MSDARVDDIALGFRRRVDAVAQRLAAIATGPMRAGLTAPDPPTGERWDAGQVWAHVAEFIAYWIAQARHVLEESVRGGSAEPVPFGRVKTDPERVAAIAHDRNRSPAVQLQSIDHDLEALRRFIVAVPNTRWSTQGIHQSLGIMRLEHIVEEFLVGHLEQHADQLEALDATPG
jgi:hypothetical protein